MLVPHQEGRTLPESILLWFLQVLGAVTAILFGAFGVLSWQVASESNQLSSAANAKSDLANSQSSTANLVALVALCTQLGADSNVSRPYYTCSGDPDNVCEKGAAPPPFFFSFLFFFFCSQRAWC